MATRGRVLPSDSTGSRIGGSANPFASLRGPPSLRPPRPGAIVERRACGGLRYPLFGSMSSDGAWNFSPRRCNKGRGFGLYPWWKRGANDRDGRAPRGAASIPEAKVLQFLRYRARRGGHRRSGLCQRVEEPPREGARGQFRLHGRRLRSGGLPFVSLVDDGGRGSP